MGDKRTLYVGGLDEQVTHQVLLNAFIPFGDVAHVELPQDYDTQKNRGFAFVEFQTKEDAAAAMENMNDAELFGRVLKVNIARPLQKDSERDPNKSVWAADPDRWIEMSLKKDADEVDKARAKREGEGKGEEEEEEDVVKKAKA